MKYSWNKDFPGNGFYGITSGKSFIFKKVLSSRSKTHPQLLSIHSTPLSQHVYITKNILNSILFNKQTTRYVKKGV